MQAILPACIVCEVQDLRKIVITLKHKAADSFQACTCTARCTSHAIPTLTGTAKRFIVLTLVIALNSRCPFWQRQYDGCTYDVQEDCTVFASIEAESDTVHTACNRAL